MYPKMYQYMADSSLFNHDTLIELNDIVTSYPYFSTARMLYLKNLAVMNDARFESELQRTAIYVPDRRALFMLIEEVRLIVETDVERPQIEKENTFNLIDDYLDAHQVGGNPELVLQPKPTVDYFNWQQGQDVEVDDSGPQLIGHEGIDQFLRDDQKRPITVRFIENDTNRAGASQTVMGDSPIDDSCFTETLAKVYIKQKKYGKALEMLQSISSKNPQKSIYFADQIRFLEKLLLTQKA